MIGNIQAIEVQIPHEVVQYWGWFLVSGIGLLALGIAAVVRSVLATVATMLFLGWLLVLASGNEIAQAVLVGHWAGFFIICLPRSVSLGHTSHFRLWHFLRDAEWPENVCQSGKTGSERCAVKVTRLTHNGRSGVCGEPPVRGVVPFDFRSDRFSGAWPMNQSRHGTLNCITAWLGAFICDENAGVALPSNPGKRCHARISY
jgi:hypothetical protein